MRPAGYLFAAQLFIKHICFLTTDDINTSFNSGLRTVLAFWPRTAPLIIYIAHQLILYWSTKTELVSLPTSTVVGYRVFIAICLCVCFSAWYLKQRLRNLTYKCSPMSPGNPCILGSWLMRSKIKVTSHTKILLVWVFALLWVLASVVTLKHSLVTQQWRVYIIENEICFSLAKKSSPYKQTELL